MATHIKDLLSNFLDIKKKETDVNGKIKEIVDKSIDRKLQKHIFLQKVYKDKVIFCSDSSSSGYEFNLNRNCLLREIKKEFPQIKELKIKIG